MTDNRTLDTHATTAVDALLRDAQREQLSAMMDGMLSTDESRFLLRRMQHDAELAERWERWQLYGDAMRGQTGSVLPADFSRRVARAIAAEAEADRAAQAGTLGAEAVGDTTVAWRQRLRWGGGAALAASVAIAALITTRNLASDPTSASQTQTEVAAAQPATTNTPAPQVGTFTVEPAVVLSMTDQTAAREAIAISPDKIPRQMASVASVSSSEAPSTQNIATTVASAARADIPMRRDSRAFLNARDLNARAQRTRDARTAVATNGRDAATSVDDPFGRQSLEINTKPWPRALLPDNASDGASVGGLTVDYSVGAVPGVHPSFQPRIETPAAPPANEDASPPDESPTP